MTGGRVVAVHVTRVRHAAPEPVEAAAATADGIEGDIHAGGSGKRQVLLVDAGDARAVGLGPGELREQLTVDLPGLMALASGTRLQVGPAMLEITGVCEPCTHIGDDLGAPDPEDLRDRLRGRRGMLARVVRPGEVRVGDAVEPATETVPRPVG